MGHHHEVFHGIVHTADTTAGTATTATTATADTTAGTATPDTITIN